MPGPKIYLRDPTDGRLERFALRMTGPDRETAWRRYTRLTRMSR